MSTAAAVVGVGKGVAGVVEGVNQMHSAERAKGEYQSESEQANIRREGTYRQDREMLMGAIEQYYGKQGWPLPKAAPGAGTSRPLPGDAPLYPGYGVPDSPWTYKQQPAAAPGQAPAATTDSQGQPVAAVPPSQGEAPTSLAAPAVVPVAAVTAPQPSAPVVSPIGIANTDGKMANLQSIAARLGGSRGYL